MRLVTLAFLLVACTDHKHSTPVNHRVDPVTCPASAGDSFGADECLSDADCAAGSGQTEVCSCAGNTFEYAHATRNLCVPADCRTDAECAPYLCSPSNGDGGPFYGVQGYYCHTPNDTCSNDSDCVNNGTQGYCMFSVLSDHWTCAYTFAAG
jgi:hypothetical protein